MSSSPSTIWKPEVVAARGCQDMSDFDELYRHHYRRVYALCLRMTGSPDRAEDLAQNVFLRVYGKLGSFRGDSSVSTWLHRVTVNEVLMDYRKRRVRAEVQGREMDAVGRAFGARFSYRVPFVERVALVTAIGRLPAGYRSVFWLHDAEGATHEEIAILLHCSPGTSKSQLHKARRRLRSLLGDSATSQERRPRASGETGAVSAQGALAGPGGGSARLPRRSPDSERSAL